MRSRTKNVGMRLDQPPNSAAEEVGWAPSRRTLIATAVRVTTTGSRSATAYHRSPTRQRTIRRSNPSTPLSPSVTASTKNAARKGKPTIGVGERSKEYRIQGHHERAQASTKNVMSGYLLIKDTRYDMRSSLPTHFPGGSSLSTTSMMPPSEVRRELRRIYLPRTPVDRGEKKGPRVGKSLPRTPPDRS